MVADSRGLAGGRQILIVGSLPPPIGGVTVHVSRTLRELKQLGCPHAFVDYRRESVFRFARALLSSNVVHAHFSNSYVRLICAIIVKLLLKKFVFTFHGNVGRYNKLRNLVDALVIRIADVPIVLNQESLRIGSRINPRTRLVSSFVPPGEVEESLSYSDEVRFQKLKESVKFLFCTSAWNYVPLGNGSDLYGITDLVEIFSRPDFADLGLVISDGSGMLVTALKEKYRTLPQNVLFVSGAHNAVAVMRRADAYIRASVTDGDSLSVKEALFCGIPVVASDCVERPDGCILYESGNSDSLIRALRSVASAMVRDRPPIPESGVPALVAIYRELLND